MVASCSSFPLKTITQCIGYRRAQYTGRFVCVKLDVNFTFTQMNKTVAKQ